MHPAGADWPARKIPLYIDGFTVAELRARLFLSMDHSGSYLKVWRSEFEVRSAMDRTPLVRLDYRADMHTAPLAHWNFHAERGAFSQMLARAHAARPKQVPKPHDLSALHLPVGGERFRPCLEDLMQFLIVDCGIDAKDGWLEAVEFGRERWRRRQLGSAVRDAPREAARVLKDLGYAVTPPNGEPADKPDKLRAW